MGNKQTVVKLPEQSTSLSRSQTQTKPVSSVSEITHDRIRREFQLACDGSGQVSRERFHAALSVLEDLDLRRLRNSPLAGLLFDFYDNKATGYINETGFVEGLSILAGNDKQAKAKLTFEAYRLRSDDPRSELIRIDTILCLLDEAWLAAFRFLAEKSSASRGDGDFTDFARKHRGSFRMVASETLREVDEDKRGSLNFSQFQEWSSSDRTISASCGENSVQLAVTFLDIEKPPPSRRKVT